MKSVSSFIDVEIEGNAVKSRLDETLLRKISVSGFYLPLRGAKAMETLYAQGLAPLPKSDSTTKLVRQYRERFHWPLGIAMLLLVLEMCVDGDVRCSLFMLFLLIVCGVRCCFY